MPITNFYQSSSKNFNITIKLNGSAQDISSDNVVFYLKENRDVSGSIYTSTADVSTSGSIGQARFSLTPTFTTQFTGSGYYDYDVIWTISSSNEVHNVEAGTLSILDNVHKNI